MQKQPLSYRIDFNTGWEFAKSSAEWPQDFLLEKNATTPVLLPHTWNEDDMGIGLNNPYIGPAWYRKTFKTPAHAPGQRLLIEFEGVANCHKVWVNGSYAGGRNGGFLTTLLDITEFLNEEGENTILVRANNSYDLKAAMPQWIDWDRHGGIHRPVWLHLRNHAYLDCAGVEIRTPEVSKEVGLVTVRTHLQETTIGGTALQVRHTLLDPHGSEISSISTPLQTKYCRTNTVNAKLPEIQNPTLWSVDKPVLYKLRTEIIEDNQVIDHQEDRVGFRFFRFDANEGFILNDQPVKLLGADIHIFFPGLGNALPERFHVVEMKLMKKMGCNYMRTSHYPRPKTCLDACDELGILVVEEQPYWHGSVRAFNGEEAIDNVTRLMQDMVRHHGSHPCIIQWNTVNEVMLAPVYKPGVGHLDPGDPRRDEWKINPGEYPYIRRHLQKMVDALKEADPDRPVSVVVGGAWDKNDQAGMTSVGDMVGYNGGAINSGGSIRFPNDLFVGPKTGKTYEFLPDYYRELYPNRIHVASEGILNDVKQLHRRDDWATSQTAWRRNARYWSLIMQRPWFCGGAMWCFTDYTANGKESLHGVVDRYRLPKDLFHFYEAMWSDHPVLHILGHWNHEAGSLREIVVFTNCKEIELTLNGRSLGPGQSCAEEYPAIPNPPFVWQNIPFEKGTLQAKGRFGATELADERVTSGEPAQIRLSTTNEHLHADGRDISFIDLTVCDAKDNRCYTFTGELTVTVSGPARLGGPSTVTVHAGLARVTIRSTGASGVITVSATGVGLKCSEIQLQANPQ